MNRHMYILADGGRIAASGPSEFVRCLLVYRYLTNMSSCYLHSLTYHYSNNISRHNIRSLVCHYNVSCQYLVA